MDDELRRCLDNLEARIDPQEEERLLAAWEEFAAGRFGSGIFLPQRSRPAPPGVAWPTVTVNAALADFDRMALQQYGLCSAQLAAGEGELLCVRCNYGTGIIPLLFGLEPFVMDESLATLPTVRPLNDTAAVRRLVERGLPGLRGGYGTRVLEMGERFAAIGHVYPRIGRYVHIYHPDLQGPLDICELVWGSSLFYALYDEPGLLNEMLALATETYIAFMRAWLAVVPFRPGANVHWGMLHQGNIMLREDSAMNLSPDAYESLVQPFDQQLLDTFGGGALHFCGRGSHYIDRAARLRGLYAINLSQPEYNDMECIYRHTVDSGIKLIGLQREAAEAALARERDLHGQVHCR